MGRCRARRPAATSRTSRSDAAGAGPDGLDAAVALVRARVAVTPWSGFQLVLSDGRRTVVLSHLDGDLVRFEAAAGEPVVVSNEHRPGELRIPDLDAACRTGLDVGERLDALAPTLLDQGERSGHRILKLGGVYGTVSSSLIAVPAADPTRLVWRYAAGSPDAAPYRNYGNLGRRLVEG